MVGEEPVAWCDGQLATGLNRYSQDLADLTQGGKWVVVVEFDGSPHLFRFDQWDVGASADVAKQWIGPQRSDYVTSLSRSQYIAGVNDIKELIAAGWLYQANLCRIMSAPLPDVLNSDPMALSALLARHNPAPYAMAIRAPEQHVEIACASPELFLGQRGPAIESHPIKGTASTVGGLTEKDRAENVMIADLVRNDLGQVCVPGSVTVPALLATERHPSVVHLVSQVAGTLVEPRDWQTTIEALFPPGSVTGAPKYSALKTIQDLETSSRGPYCGAMGWIDVDRDEGQLAVGIRSFWITRADQRLHFGTGAGITWGSSAVAEWNETELKSRHLTGVAARRWPE